jgi:hypothetical protein
MRAPLDPVRLGDPLGREPGVLDVILHVSVPVRRPVVRRSRVLSGESRRRHARPEDTHASLRTGTRGVCVRIPR